MLATTLLALCALAASGESFEVRLTSQDIASSQYFYVSYGSYDDGNEVIFKAEPAYEGIVFRGSIALDEDAFIGFAWDRDGGRLYIDQNRNLDLTDDPDGVYTAQEGQGFEGAGYYNQSFQDVRVHPKDASVNPAYRLQLNNYSGDYVHGFVLSGWAGNFEAGGTSYRIEYTDQANAVLGEDDTFLLLPRTAELGDDAVMLPRQQIPEKVVLDDTVYTLDLAFAEGGDQVVATFAETEEPLGTVALAGEHLRLLVLTGPAYAVVGPDTKRFSLPTGSSRVAFALVGDHLLCSASDLPTVTVARDGETTLRIGGPLHHQIDVDRRGTYLDLSYRLLGVGGEEYHNVFAGYDQGPAFTVHQGDRLIGKGRFTYG